MHFRLKVVKGKPRGHCLTFQAGEYMFGRGPECDVRPISDLVSRQHCLLHIADDSAFIRDLGSCNGTLVNGQLVVGEQTLQHGDTLQIGPLVLEVMVDVAAGAVSCDTALMNQDETALRDRPPLGETCDQRVLKEEIDAILHDPSI